MAKADEEISAEDFARWLTPRQCVMFLATQWTESVIRATLIDRAAHRLLLARADTMVVSRGGSSVSLPRLVVPTDAWKGDDAPGYHSHFWENGNHRFEVGYGSQEKKFVCFDIRFEPEAVARLRAHDRTPDELAAQLSQKSGSPTAASTNRIGNLSPAEQRRFCELYLAVFNESPKEGHALQAILAMYPDKKVPRDPFFAIFRTLRGPGKRGRPSIRGK